MRPDHRIVEATAPRAARGPPGRITSHRLQSAVVLYLSLATIFASAYGLVWELSPDSFATLLAPAGGPEEVAAMLYFSLTTLSTTGYGDIVAVDPFARSLANWRRLSGNSTSRSQSLAW
jgi:Ion channel